MKTCGDFTVPRYHIKATLGMIIINGTVVRNECTDKINLGTELGVERWIKSSNPLVSLRVLEGDVDVTDQFKKYAEFMPSRYQGGVSFIDISR